MKCIMNHRVISAAGDMMCHCIRLRRGEDLLESIRRICKEKNVQSGVILSGVGLWGPVVAFAGAGATVPLLGFGYTMAEGVRTALQEQGMLGILTGGLKAAAGGITAAVFFSLIGAVLFKPGDRS